MAARSPPRRLRSPGSTGRAITRPSNARSGHCGWVARRLITNDAFAALRAGISGHAGCVSSAGTGAVAAGRNAAGETARTMALGFGEIGGAGDIVERSLWACARMREASGPDTALATALCDALGARDLDDLFESITRRGLAAGAELAPLVLGVAAGGDGVARELLAGAGAVAGRRGARSGAQAAHAGRAVRARGRGQRAPGRVGLAG